MDKSTNLDNFFKPKSVCLIGASHDKTKLGGVILRNLLKFKGKVYPVNPKYKKLMGIKSYPSVPDIPASVDLSIIMRPAPEVPGILKDLKNKSCCALIMSSGFAEIGETVLQEKIRKIGIESGIRIIGPNCMGIFNPYQKLDTFFLPYERLPRPKKGNVAIVSQSGAILSCILGELKKSNTGISTAVGYGNAVDINESDLFEYFANDSNTGVVISYIESVIDGRIFIEKAKLLSEKKPLLVLKSGKSSSGGLAAHSHTGRLAGRYEVFHSILKQFGIQEADDFDELIDSTKALSFQRQMKGNRVCIITNGGGSGVLATDECIRQGLEVPKLPDIKRDILKKIFPHFYGINNPFDLTGQVKDEDYATALNKLKDDFDSFLIIALPNVLGISERLGGIIKEILKGFNKPVVFYVSEGGISKKLTALLEKAKVPVYPSPERAVRGLKSLLIS